MPPSTMSLEAGQSGDDEAETNQSTEANGASASKEWQQLAPLHEAGISPTLSDMSRRQFVLERWRNAALRAVRRAVDPWRKYNIHNMPLLRARRFRYSATRKTWVEDFVEIKMCMEPFARGAMRECFRVKKLSSMGFSQDWEHAHNYVAKRYIQEVDKQVIFDDVKLQLDCKLWAEEFNRNRPPKKIDIVQMNVIQILDLPDEPYYHLEHFIEGEYVKYNSNSGFVCEMQRQTPHAFSHFTFERSGHQLIVVDIQGVGDLYTDPQIHTVSGTDYGDGNLGTKGMALFFHSHQCNAICRMLCLTEFDLAVSERERLKEDCAKLLPTLEPTHFTKSRKRNEQSCNPLLDDLAPDDAMESLRRRSESLRIRYRSMIAAVSPTFDAKLEHNADCTCEHCIQELCSGVNLEDEDSFSESTSRRGSLTSPSGRKWGRTSLSIESPDFMFRRRTPDSMCSSVGDSSRVTGITERDEYWASQRKKSIPAGVITALESQPPQEIAHALRHISILGQVHLDLARYHEVGRFLKEEEANCEKLRVLHELTSTGSSISSSTTTTGDSDVKYDQEAALYHLDIARRCGNLEAILTVAKMCYHLPHELLKEIGNDVSWFADTAEDFDKDVEEFSFDMMLSAAEMGDRGAILFVAEAYETGNNMGKRGEISYTSAIFWLEKSLGFADDEEGTEQHRPRHELLANMARLYQEGGYGLDGDLTRAYELYNEAAEAAMENMKGKLANKYYECAEMCAI
ncbi:unnamed protein product, partial [Mesorhabditis spiculigera]